MALSRQAESPVSEDPRGRGCGRGLAWSASPVIRGARGPSPCTVVNNLWRFSWQRTCGDGTTRQPGIAGPMTPNATVGNG
jgi:hypothetical protein